MTRILISLLTALVMLFVLSILITLE